MYLLDTNVVSEMRKILSGRADAGLTAWAATVEVASLFLSVITLQELEIGVLLTERRDSRQGRHLREWLNHQVLPAFAGRIIPVDAAVAQRSAGLHVPDPKPFRDTLIGATALVHGFVVVTRNVVDFQPLGVSILNPWEE